MINRKGRKFSGTLNRENQFKLYHHMLLFWFLYIYHDTKLYTFAILFLIQLSIVVTFFYLSICYLLLNLVYSFIIYPLYVFNHQVASAYVQKVSEGIFFSYYCSAALYWCLAVTYMLITDGTTLPYKGF